LADNVFYILKMSRLYLVEDNTTC